MRAWVDRVERVGNLNYPEEARRQGLSGRLIMTVSVRRDGSVKGVVIQRPAASRCSTTRRVRIVKLASPFPPLPHTARGHRHPRRHAHLGLPQRQRRKRVSQRRRGEHGLQHRHAHRDAVADLLEDQRLRRRRRRRRRSRRRGSSAPDAARPHRGAARRRRARVEPVVAVVLARANGTRPSSMRSRCRRSIITTSTPSSAASKSSTTVQPCSVASHRAAAPPAPQTRISPAPSVRSACRSERATREWRTSPTISDLQLREIRRPWPGAGSACRAGPGSDARCGRRRR